jgi:hypothetical protein
MKPRLEEMPSGDEGEQFRGAVRSSYVGHFLRSPPFLRNDDRLTRHLVGDDPVPQERSDLAQCRFGRRGIDLPRFATATP